MSKVPFGFGPGTGGGQPEDIAAAFTRLGQLLSWQGGPVNWDLARDVSRQAVSAAGDRSVAAAESQQVADALRLAELWLDPTTVFAAVGASAEAWSRAEWLENTLPGWRGLVDPVAARIVDALSGMLTAEDGPLAQHEQLPEQLQALGGVGALAGLGGLGGVGGLGGLGGQLQQMMQSMGGAMFGAQIGQALGALAIEVLGSTDVGLPLGPPKKAALVPANVAAFGEGLDLPLDQIRLYLALREAAHHRLFGHVPWLRAHLVDAVGAYAQGIKVDLSQLRESMGNIDPTNPAGLQDAFSGGLFEPEDTPQQKAALARLETMLALIEGWVDEVVDAAATAHLPGAAALRETVRRRRATGGPAEQTFASLVGLELRPRRLREAASLWKALLSERGVEGRDGVWAHPDLLPVAEDLDDPEAFARGSTPLDLSSLEPEEPPPASSASG
jgi:putative hydrolase